MRARFGPPVVRGALVAAAAAAVTALAACAFEPPQQTSPHFDLTLSALEHELEGEPPRRMIGCQLRGWVTLGNPAPESGTVPIDLLVSRSYAEESPGHSEWTEAADTLRGAVLEYAGLGTRELRATLVIEGRRFPLAPARANEWVERLDYRGDWSCGPDIPLAADSALVAHGADSTHTVGNGWWNLSETPDRYYF